MTHLHTIEGDSRFVKGKVVESALEFYVQRKSVRVKKEVVVVLYCINSTHFIWERKRNGKKRSEWEKAESRSCAKFDRLGSTKQERNQETLNIFVKKG